METERKATSDLLRRLEEEKRRHADTQSQLDQVTGPHRLCNDGHSGHVR